MRHTRFASSSFVLALVASAVLAACGGDGGGSPATGVPPAGATGYRATALVADAGTVTPIYGSAPAGAAAHVDPNLVNPWGLVFNPQGFSWIANAGTATSTLYDGNGVAQSLVVTLPTGQNPSGIVFNGTSDFSLTQAGKTGTAAFVFATLEGQIAAWAPAVDGTHAFTTVDNGAAGAVYTGLANGASAGANRLFAANFVGGKVDTFDGTFAPVTTTGGFTDPTLPTGYAPFGIQQIGGKVYVTYAQPDPTTHEKIGAGLGLVDVFDTDGHLLTHLVAVGGVLNAPWGVAMAPTGFGKFSGMILVGNFGDGLVHAFDPTTGALQGTLSDASGAPLAFPGLWALQFGNGLNAQPATTLFYTAGPSNETHGVYGRVDAN